MILKEVMVLFYKTRYHVKIPANALPPISATWCDAYRYEYRISMICNSIVKKRGTLK
jgi:hypothetical protein